MTNSARFFYVAWKISEAYDVPKLAQQTVFAYDAIISGGRTPLVMKREKGWPVFGGSSYHLDVDLFRATLCYVGPAQFVTNILKRFLKAALTPNGRRAGTSMSSFLEFLFRSYRIAEIYVLLNRTFSF